MQKNNLQLLGNLIDLKILTQEIMSQNYLLWLKDNEVNKYLETKGDNINLKMLTEYVTNMYMDPNNYLFGIFDKKGVHIGNIKLGNISQVHKRADIGLLIGEKSYWGKGIASEAIGILTKFSFNILKLHKVYAGIYSNNIGSIHAFKKNKFYKSATFKEHAFYENNFIDVYFYETINND